MQVEHGPQAVLFTVFQREVDAREALGLHAAVLVLDHVVVDRQAHVVEAPAGDLREVLLRDEAVEALGAVIALAQPAAEIDPLVKAAFL